MVNDYYSSFFCNEPYLAHYGILGMKWGVRRYQNADGSYTAAGKARRGTTTKRSSSKNSEAHISEKTSRKRDEEILSRLSDKLNKIIDEESNDPRYDEMSEDYEGPSERFRQAYYRYQEEAMKFYEKYGYQ